MMVGVGRVEQKLDKKIAEHVHDRGRKIPTEWTMGLIVLI